MKSINAGMLRNLITLTPPGAASKDADGFNTTGDGIAVNMWAALENLHGVEGMEAARLTGKATAKFTIRYMSTLTNHWKLTYAGTEYKILYLDDIWGRHQWIEILAEAVR